jgi:hypothetical protein
MASLELHWLVRTDFFPGPQEDWARLGRICVATKTRTIGDALVLSTLPRKLREKYGLRVTTYPRGFNPIVFRHNPHVSGVQRLPRAVYGDDNNAGGGQLIQMKERFFGLPVSDPPRPELYLHPREAAWAARFLAARTLPGNEGKPLCLLHPWGRTQSQVATMEFWDAAVARWKDRVRFWQVGITGHPAIQGCEYYFLQSRRYAGARQLFALAARAQAFLGVDSGPMHVARAFALPSLVVITRIPQDAPQGTEEEFLAERDRRPYVFDGTSHFHSFLYRENRHAFLRPDRLAADGPRAQRLIDGFLGSLAST